MNFSIANFIKALNIIQQMKEEIQKSGFYLGKWVDVVFKLFPAIVNFLEMFAPTPTPTPPSAAMASNAVSAMRAEVEAAGFDFGTWIALLVKLAPLIQQLIDVFTKTA